MSDQPISFMTEAELETYKLHRRFDRFGRLIGDEKIQRLMKSHVMVIGLGGVGSWAAEAVARSGIGSITLVDFDEVCVTNCNRQLQAVTGTIGKAKAEVLAERIRLINPQAEITTHIQFYNAENAAKIFLIRPDFVIDAIDNVTAKCHLLNHCRSERIPVVCSTGASGRLDPTRIQVRDLSETEIDPLAKALRKILRQEYSFPDSGAFDIPAVFSMEEASDPHELHYDGGKGFRCVCPHGGNNGLHSCENRNMIRGTAAFVTAAFGMACASVAVRKLIE